MGHQAVHRCADTRAGTDVLGQPGNARRHWVQCGADIGRQPRDRSRGAGVGYAVAANQGAEGRDGVAHGTPGYARSTDSAIGVADVQAVADVGDEATDQLRQTRLRGRGCRIDVATRFIKGGADASQHATDECPDWVACTAGTCHLATQAGDSGAHFIDQATDRIAQACLIAQVTRGVFHQRDDGYQYAFTHRIGQAAQWPGGAGRAQGVAKHGHGLADFIDQATCRAAYTAGQASDHGNAAQRSAQGLAGVGHAGTQVGHAIGHTGNGGAQGVAIGAQGAQAVSQAAADAVDGSARCGD